jgi:hypothetical protein
MALVEMQIVVDQGQGRLGKREIARTKDADHPIAGLFVNPHLGPHRDVVHPRAGARIGEEDGAFAAEHPEAISHDSPGLLLRTTRPFTCFIWL